MINMFDTVASQASQVRLRPLPLLLTLLLRMPASRDAPATLPGAASAAFWPLQRSQTLQLLLLAAPNAPATLPDIATATFGTTGSSCNAPGR